MQQTTFTLEPVPPYDFGLAAGYATNFRGRYGPDLFEQGVFRRLLDLTEDRLVLVSARSRGTVEAPRLEVTATGPALDRVPQEVLSATVKRLLGTEADLAPFYRLAQKDPALAPLVRVMYGLHLPQAASVYEALVFSILGQQISSHVARMLRGLLVQTYGRSLEVEGVTYHAFPQPETLVEAGVEGLRGVKLSARKAEYIGEVARRVGCGELDLEGLRALPDEEVLRRLTALRGVGQWTVQWLLVRALGRPDGFPSGDLALQRTLGLLVNGGVPLGPEEALAYSQRWAPFRSYVTGYLFAAVRSDRFASLTGAGQAGS